MRDAELLERRDFGLQLKAWREGANFTMQRLADEVGVSKQLIHYWEMGVKHPGPETKQRLMDFFENMTRARGLR